MRYEIFFVSSGPMTSPQVAFEHYFEKRPLYKVGRGTARYENTDTGVRFAFDCTAEPVVPPGAQRPWARGCSPRAWRPRPVPVHEVPERHSRDRCSPTIFC